MQPMAITTSTPVTEETYREIALGDPKWELHHGLLREKPGMSVAHANVIDRLQRQLYSQLGEHAYRLRPNFAKLRRSADTYYIPDIAVIPAHIVQALSARPGSLDAYGDPLPLVVEIWSPSTGDYNINEKLPDYQARGDQEIWYIHPYQRTLTAWRRTPSGTYDEVVYRGGMVRVTSLPGVVIDMDALCEP
jgi:Uma2 family endonuclease